MIVAQMDAILNALGEGVIVVPSTTTVQCFIFVVRSAGIILPGDRFLCFSGSIVDSLMGGSFSLQYAL